MEEEWEESRAMASFPSGDQGNGGWALEGGGTPRIGSGAGVAGKGRMRKRGSGMSQEWHPQAGGTPGFGLPSSCSSLWIFLLNPHGWAAPSQLASEWWGSLQLRGPQQ